MSWLATMVSHDFETGLAEVVFRGEVSMETAAEVRSTLLKCFAEHPAAVLADMNEVTVRSDLAVTVFAALANAVEPDFTVRLLVYAAAARPAGRALPRAIGSLVPVYENRAAALDAIAAGPAIARRVHLHLPAQSTSPGVARALIGYACSAWDLPHLSDDAQIIVSELVANAVEHAGSDLDVTSVLRHTYLHIRVRDRSPLPPTLGPEPDPVSEIRSPGADRGRGLWLVNALATGWGTTLGEYGKTVWATLRVHPLNR